MLSNEDANAFEEDFRALFKANSDQDILIDYVVIASAIEPSTGGMYTTLLVPEGQRAPQTAGLVRLGVVVSDRMLNDSTFELMDDEDDDDEDNRG